MNNKAYDFYSNNGLNRIYNNFGMASLDRGINVPDAALAIGHGETLAPIGVVFSYTPIQRMQTSPIESVNDTFVKTQGKGLQIDSFPMENYYGDSLGVY